MKLVSVPDPLERAAKLLNPLATFAATNIDVWIATYDVAIRRKKYLQAAKALMAARSLHAEHPELHIRAVEFRKTTSSLPQPPPSPIGPVLAAALATILPEEISLETFNSQYLQRHSTSGPAILAAAKASHKLDAPREEVEVVVFTALGESTNLDIKTALAIISFLSEIKSPHTDEFRVACNARFKLSTVFRTSAELEALHNGKVAPQIATGDSAEVIV